MILYHARIPGYTKVLGSSGSKTESSLYMGSGRTLPNDKIGTAGDLNSGGFIAVKEAVEVSKEEGIQRGGVSGRGVRGRNGQGTRPTLSRGTICRWQDGPREQQWLRNSVRGWQKDRCWHQRGGREN